MSIVTIRGATTINNNTKEDILNETKKLLLKIEQKNNINKNKVISILFSATKDLNTQYPAKAARILGYTTCGLMCFQEMDVTYSIRKCIRVLVMYDDDLKQNEVKHIYLKNAKNLRPDLI